MILQVHIGRGCGSGNGYIFQKLHPKQAASGPDRGKRQLKLVRDVSIRAAYLQRIPKICFPAVG